jgi:hypothetical protein
VLKISNLGFFVVFVPNSERARLERDLAATCLSIHGTALHTSDEESIFVAVVKAESPEQLQAIAHRKGSSGAASARKQTPGR